MMTADWRGSFVPALTQIKATGRRFGSNRPMTESRLAPDAPRLEVSPLSKAEAPAAFALARENKIPIIVFSIAETGAIASVLAGGGRSTLVAP